MCVSPEVVLRALSEIHGVADAVSRRTPAVGEEKRNIRTLPRKRSACGKEEEEVTRHAGHPGDERGAGGVLTGSERLGSDASVRTDPRVGRRHAELRFAADALGALADPRLHPGLPVQPLGLLLQPAPDRHPSLCAE